MHCLFPFFLHSPKEDFYCSVMQPRCASRGKLEAKRATIFHLEIGAMQKEVIQVEQVIVKRRPAKHVVCQVNREKMPNAKIVIEMIEVGDDIILGHRAGILAAAKKPRLLASRMISPQTQNRAVAPCS